MVKKTIETDRTFLSKEKKLNASEKINYLARKYNIPLGFENLFLIELRLLEKKNPKEYGLNTPAIETARMLNLI